jgi:hypothetical protein
LARTAANGAGFFVPAGLVLLIAVTRRSILCKSALRSRIRVESSPKYIGVFDRVGLIATYVAGKC